MFEQSLNQHQLNTQRKTKGTNNYTTEIKAKLFNSPSEENESDHTQKDGNQMSSEDRKNYMKVNRLTMNHEYEDVFSNDT